MYTPTPESLHVELGWQHRRMLAQLESLTDKLKKDPATGLADETRTLLIDIGMHFGFEELLMQEGGYPDFESHRRQHIGIMTELGHLLDRVETVGETIKVLQQADFLSHWYHEHVAHSDAPMEAWLTAQRQV